MNTTKNLPGLLTAMLLAQAGSAQAGFVTYTDKAAFLSAVSGAQTDSFNDLVIFQSIGSPLIRTGGNYNYQAEATDGFFQIGPVGDTWLSTNNPTPINFSLITGNQALGGFFFCNDFEGALTSGTISVSINGGLFLQSVSTNSAENFLGWISDDGAPITSFQVTASGAGVYPTVNDLVFAQAAAVPEPSTYSMALAALACGGFSVWRRRRRA